MATEYHKLREPITGLVLKQGERHSELTLFVGLYNAGTLAFGRKELTDFLKLLADTSATAVMVTGISVDVRMKIDEPNLPNLISEWGDLRSLNQIKADWSNKIERHGYNGETEQQPLDPETGEPLLKIGRIELEYGTRARGAPDEDTRNYFR